MENTELYKIDNPIDQRWFNPTINKYSVVKKLNQLLSNNIPKETLNKIKSQIKRTLDHPGFDNKLRNRSKQIIWKVYWSRQSYMHDLEARKSIELLQTAFIEMESLFFNLERKQEWKNWSDHILWILDELLELDEVNVEQFIVAILHDSVEDIPWYTIDHVREVYGENIAKSVENISKKSWFYYQNKVINDKTKNIAEMSSAEFDLEVTRTKQKEYYGSMVNRWKNELIVKFIDRLHSLRSMEWTGNAFLNKKLHETKKYFLIDEIKVKVWEKIYNKLEQEYLRLNTALTQNTIK